MDPMTIASVATPLLSSIFGKKKAPPTIPFKPVNAQEEQEKALEANLANSSSLEALITRGNRFAQDEALSLAEQAMPGYTKLAERMMKLSNELATNPYDLPPDVQKNLERQAAERGIAVGGRGQFEDFSLLRDLGVNQLEYGQQRIGQAGGLMQMLAGLAPRVNPMSPMSLYITPQQQMGATMQQNEIQQSIAQGGANATTAARNFNTQNIWDAFAMTLGGLGPGTSTGGGSKGTQGSFPAGFGNAMQGYA